MKSFLSFLLTSLIVTTIASCHRYRGGHWPDTTKYGDSIVRILDRSYFLDSLQTIPPLADSLNNEAIRHPENIPLQLSSLYWKILAYRNDNPDSAKIWIQQFRNITDSKRDLYLTARIDLLEQYEINNDNFLSLHHRLKEKIEYFQSIHDLPMEMMATRQLGNFYARIGDMKKYRDNAIKINELCRQIGNPALIAKSTLNLGLAEIHAGDSAKASEIFHNLLLSPIAKEDSIFQSRIYINLGELEGEPEHFKKAIALNRQFNQNPHYHASLQLAMMKKYELKGLFPQADSIFSIISPIVIDEGDAEARIAAYKILLRHSKEKRDFDSYIRYSDSIKRLESEVFSIPQYEELTKDALTMELNRSEEHLRERNRIASLKIIFLIVIGVLNTLIIIFYYRARTARLNLSRAEDKIRMAEIEKENMKDKNSLSAMAMSMTARNRLITDLTSTAERLRRTGQLSADTEETLLKNIRMAQIDINEWDNFQEAYSKVHPMFLKKLKENYPDITEGDSRLALYIAAGFSNKQISRIMQLQPDSIKKNRQRLRQRMHIGAEQSLEETLRLLL